MKTDDQAPVVREICFDLVPRQPVVLLLSTLMLLLCACSTIDVNEYALQPAGDVSGMRIIGRGTCPKHDLGPVPSLAGTERPTAQEALAVAPLVAAISPYNEQESLLPVSLQATPVMKTIFEIAKVTAASAAYERFQAENATVLEDAKRLEGSNFALSDAQRTALTVKNYQSAYLKRLERSQSPGALSEKDFRNFADEFSEQVLRHTKSSSVPAQVSEAADDAFWERAQAYYSAYAAGKFVDYFGTKYAKPSLSKTVTDGELANLVGVFLEIAFDASAKTPVWTQMDSSQRGDIEKGSTTVRLSTDVSTRSWKKGMSISADDGAIPSGATIAGIANDGRSITLSVAATKSAAGAGLLVTPTALAQATYWPGDSTNEPTVLAIARPKREAAAMSLDSKSVGCGMTVLKAKAINTVAQEFSGAASSSAGAAIGTIGGVGFSVGIFGKVSIGDNKAVTSLIQAVVSELVKRLTVETMYPVLQSVNLQKASGYQMTALFASPNHGNTPLHHTWLP